MRFITQKNVCLVLNCALLAFGISVGPLVMRQYYLAGGHRVWFAAWLETGGWPVMLIPVIACYINRRRTSDDAKLFLMSPKMFLGSAVLGTLTGLDDYMYSQGVKFLPVSTSSILLATQLAFMALFAWVLVKFKFTPFTVNSVVLLTLGAMILGLHTDGDRPAGVSKKQYWMGFFMTLLAAVLYGFILPAVELMFKKSNRTISYALVIETQMVMCFFATFFCTIGMWVNNDFQALVREGGDDKHGVGMYGLVVTASALVWTCFFMGAVGVLFYSSSVLAGTIMAVFLPVTEILAIIFYGEKFHAEKGISLFLALWGFLSYLVGEFNHNKRDQVNDESQSDTILSNV